jgi:hypothetical protein
MPGKTLAIDGWKASYTELGEVPPVDGPRDGILGRRSNPKNINCGYMLICERDQQIENLVDIRDNGLQYAGDVNRQGLSILIIGGSVAWGAYASSKSTTYFSVLQSNLTERLKNPLVTVLARGGARSDDDLAAFLLRGKGIDPDIVMFLNGLNDVYIPGPEGLEMDYRKYVRNTELARRTASDRGIPFIVVLQPFPHGKKTKSKFESAMMIRVKTAGYPDEFEVESARNKIREGLTKIAGHESAYFIDCSTAFDNEVETVFSDQWHFADNGQRLLANCIQTGLEPLLQARER